MQRTKLLKEYDLCLKKSIYILVRNDTVSNLQKISNLAYKEMFKYTEKIILIYDIK